MMKAILLLLIVALLYWIFFSRRARMGAASSEVTKIRKVVSCNYCNLHVPEGEAIYADGRSYCCDEHRWLDAS